MIYETLDAMWLSAVRTAFIQEQTASRNGPARDVYAFHGRVEDPLTVPTSRRFSPTYTAGELLWYLSGDDGEMICHYAPGYGKYMVTHPTTGRRYAPGAYGPRWMKTLPDILKLLRSDINTRRAVLVTSVVGDVRADTPDQPCTLSLQFLYRDGRLHLIATMRSNDIWLGMPYDMFAFTRIQRLVADELGLAVGTYTHQAGSLHLYRKDEKLAMERSNVPVPSRVSNFKPIPQGKLLEAISLAALFEEQHRTGKMTGEVVEIAVTSGLLGQTELGAMVLIATMKKDGYREVEGWDLSYLVNKENRA